MLARVKAVLRRSRATQRPPPVPPAALAMDEDGWRGSWQGRALHLTPNEFRLLRTLASQRGRVFARSQLLESLHGDEHVITERAVDSHVKNLQRKLAVAGAGHERIQSVYGVGYCYDD